MKQTNWTAVLMGLLVIGLIAYFYLWLVPFIIKYMLSIWGVTVALKQLQLTLACIYGLILAFKPNRKAGK